MSTDASKDLAAELDGVSSLALTQGSNLFWGPIRAVSSNVAKNSVFCFLGTGRVPDRFMGKVTEIRYDVVHVRVRNAKNGAGSALAHSIVDHLQDAGITGYLDVRILSAGPQLLGQDDDGTNLWTMSFELVREVSA